MNQKSVFDTVRAAFGPLSPQQVDGFNVLFSEYVASTWTDSRWFAYLLATAWHETGFTMEPVREAFWMSELWREQHLRYWPWYGRGFCQLTWKANYAKADSELGLNGALLATPDLALKSDVAAKVIFKGMDEGWFTGRRLKDYIAGGTCDYVNARRIINGLDKASAIAAYAASFEKSLNVSL